MLSFLVIAVVFNAVVFHYDQKEMAEIDKRAKTTPGYIVNVKIYTPRYSRYGEFEYSVNGRDYIIKEHINEWDGLGSSYEVVYDSIDPEKAYVLLSSPLISDRGSLEWATGEITEIDASPNYFIKGYAYKGCGLVYYKYNHAGEVYRFSAALNLPSTCRPSSSNDCPLQNSNRTEPFSLL